MQVTDDPKVWFQAAIRAEGDDLLLHTTDSLPDEVAQELREAGWQPDEWTASAAPSSGPHPTRPIARPPDEPDRATPELRIRHR